MKRFLSFCSWLLLLAGIGACLAILLGLPTLQPAAPKSAGSSTGSNPQDLSAFPINETKVVDFDIDNSIAEQMTPRELADQERDWLLLTVASHSGATTSAVNRSLFDLIPIRHGYLDQLCRFDYGETRSFCLDGRRLVALVPKADDRVRSDNLAVVFDAARKNLGGDPQTIEVFEYTLDKNLKGTITRRRDVPGAALVSPDSGYHERYIDRPADLQEFLAEVDDLTLAKLDNNRLLVGGRRLSTRARRNISLEEVAAVWQSEHTILARQKEFNRKWEQRQRTFNDEWQYKRSSYRSQYDLALEKLQQEYDEDAIHSHLGGGSGFSLDPVYDYAGLASALAKPTLAEVLKTTSWSTEIQGRCLFDAWLLLSESQSSNSDKAGSAKNGVATLGSITLAGLIEKAGFSDEVLQQIVVALSAPEASTTGSGGAKSKPGELPFLRLLDKARAEADNDASGLLSEILEALDNRFRLQKARYDGELQGTRVGMILFYTDLLAKLWAMDYTNGNQSQAVSEFTPLPQIVLSAAYRAEEEALPSTRLWFGPEDNGFQILPENGILFASNATRIYAASSNPLEPGKETEPTPSANAFLGWWNNHYEEVAQYEPQYQLLNEIMKWSLVISWLNKTSSNQFLSFLADAAVSKTMWFPDWVQDKGDLRFRNWSKVSFYPHGYLGTRTETMPVLFSRRFRQFSDEDASDPRWTISGGVSLASKELVETRTALSESIPDMLRRSNIDYGKLAGQAEDELVTTRGIRYDFYDGDLPGVSKGRVSRTAITPREGQKFWSKYGDFKISHVETTVVRDSAGTKFQVNSTSGEIGHLRVMPTKNGFRVGWRAREIDNGIAVARSLSRAPDINAALKSNPLLQYVFKDSAGVYYLKNRAMPNWMRVVPEGKNTVEIAQGWDGRFAELDQLAKPINVSWVSASKIPKDVLAGAEWIRGPPTTDAGTGLLSDGENFWPFGIKSWKDTALEIEKDPVEFKKVFNLHLAKELEEIDALIAARRPQDALSNIEEALAQFGEHEQLRLRQALVELNRNRPEAAADAANNLVVTNREQGANLIQEINERLKSARQADERLYHLAEFVDWKTPGATQDGDIVSLVANDSGKLSSEIRIKDVRSSVKVRPEDVPEGATVYCQDTPHLNSLDWGVGVRSAMDQISQRQLAEVIALPRADIAHFDPTQLYVGEDRFLRATSSPARSSVGNQVYSSYVPWANSTNSNGGDDDEKKKRNGFDKIYLVIPHVG